jgi:hypothetical protein
MPKMWLFRAYIDGIKFKLLVIFAMIAAGTVAYLVGRIVARIFALGEDGTMYTMAGCFFATLGVAAWVYDKFQTRRFFSE